MGNGLARRLLASLALGIVVALVLGLVAAFLVIQPPRTIRLAAGQAGGMYATFAAALEEQLARAGYDVVVMETAGSVENAELLRTGKADVGLVQSGTELLEDIGGSTALSEVFYEPLWLFAREEAVPIVDGRPQLAGTRVGIGPAGSGTNVTARQLLQQSAIEAEAVELSSSEAVDGLRDGSIDAAFFVLAPNAPLIQDLLTVPGITILPVPNVEGLARRMPYLSSVTLFSGVLRPQDPAIPPRDIPMLAARATLLGREGLHPDLARLIVRETPDALPVPYVGELDAFPSLERTTLPINEDARTFLEDGPTPLEAFLPFEIASPLSRIYLILLPLLVVLFPLYTLLKAGWDWFHSSRVMGWYPRINAIERRLETSSLSELLAQQDFLRSLDSELATQKRVPAGYLSNIYDLRIDAAFVRQRVEARIAELGGQAAVDAAHANDAEAIDPRKISDEAMGLERREPSEGT